MEPFDLTLQQVNLEEKDITEDDTLHSFSNLVSFDSEFTDDKSDVYPVLGKLVNLSQGTNTDNQQTIFSQQYHGREEVFPVKHHLVSSFTSPPGYIRHHGDSVAIEPSEDPFVGFTDAADALALQKSVIGNVSRNQDSQDNVASILANAQEKLQMFNDTLSNSSVISAQDNDNSSLSEGTSTEAVVAEYRRQKQSMYGNKQKETISEQLLEKKHCQADLENVNKVKANESSLISSTSAPEDASDSVDLEAKNESVVNDVGDVQSESLLFVRESGDVDSTCVKQLIQIPGDQLVKEVEKRSPGWFAKKEIPRSQKMNKQRRTSDKQSSLDHSSADDSPKISHTYSEEEATAIQMDASSLSSEVSTPAGRDSNTGRSVKTSVFISEAATYNSSQSPTVFTSTDTVSSTSKIEATKEDTYVFDKKVEHIVETQHLTSEQSVTVTKEVNIIRETPDLPVLKKSHPVILPSKESEDLESLKAELDRLLRENANYEGRIEVLQAESATVMKERAQLQSLVATLQQQVKVAHRNVDEIKKERDAVVADIETLKLNRANLEQVIMNAKKLLQDRDEDIRTLKDDLKLSQDANEKLQKKIKEEKMQRISDQSVIQDLKAKITELYVDFQMSNQDRILAESEIKSLQSEVKSLAMAKEWYQEQLKLCQDAKASLQKEISSVKSELIGQTTMVERLKADNIQIKQHLAEAEQRALSEKEKLALHLEAIESQMVEREATFVQLQQEKLSIEATLQQRLEKGRDDMSGEVAEELKKARNELQKRQAAISVLEHEQVDLVKRLTLSQESILERDKTIESLNRRLIDTEVQLQQIQLQVREKEDEIYKLREEKSGIEIEVNSLKKEKQAIDLALQTLKSDMGKVEQSFKHMKQEMKNKQQQIEQLQAENGKLNQQLEDTQKMADMTRLAGEPRHESLQGTAVKRFHEDKISDVEELQKHVEMLETHSAEMTHRLEAVRSESGLLIEEMRSENQKLKEHITDLDRQLQESSLNNSTLQEGTSSEVQSLIDSLQSAQDLMNKWNSQSPTDRTSLINELQKLQNFTEIFISSHKLSLHELILLLNSVIIQNKNFINILISGLSHNQPITAEWNEQVELEYKAKLEEHNLKIKSFEEENMKLKQQYNELVKTIESEREEHLVKLSEKDQLYGEVSSTVVDLQRQLDDLKNSKEKLEEEKISNEALEKEHVLLEQENTDLKIKLAKLETDSHLQIAKQKAKALKLGKDLEAALKASHQQKQLHDAAVKEYEEKITALVNENNKLQEKLEEAEKKISLDTNEKVIQLQQELHEVHRHYEEKTSVELQLREIISKHEVDMSKFTARIEELQQQLALAEVALERYRANEEDTRRLQLELEKEKGKLAGAMQSHTALKEHTSSLEAALAQHQSSSVQVTSEIAARLEKKEKEVDFLKEQIEQLKSTLETEKQNNQLMQEQLSTEKADHVKVRRDLENLFIEHDQLKVIAEGYEQSVRTLNEELEKMRESDSKHRTELEHLSQEVRSLREEKDRAFMELEARRNKEPIIQEQIKSLEWQVTEKDNEIVALKKQLSAVNQREQIETSSLANSLQSAKMSLKELREELVAIKQEKTMLLTRIAELKAALQASLQHIKLLQTEGQVGPINVSFNLESLENLLKEQKSTTIDSKPLNFLQATLSKLRGEISSLQSQVDKHALAVQTTSKTWKEFEEQVKDLREVCMMSAADRAASEKIILEGKKLSENPVLPVSGSSEQSTGNSA